MASGERCCVGDSRIQKSKIQNLENLGSRRSKLRTLLEHPIHEVAGGRGRPGGEVADRIWASFLDLHGGKMIGFARFRTCFRNAVPVQGPTRPDRMVRGVTLVTFAVGSSPE